VDLASYQRSRQVRADQQLIVLFSKVLSQPLTLRELTPEQQARRDARLAARPRRRRVPS
jgi:hypothetical protein